MENFIQNPISHKDWNPRMGDFFSERIYEEDRMYERKLFRKKMLVSGLFSIHMLMLAIVFFYFA